jgi:hypothetical protein
VNAEKHTRKTWTRVEHAKEKVDELVLVGKGTAKPSLKISGKGEPQPVM